ncbi:response regulator [Gracilimonas mengyeensis]|uniref:Two-component system, chemotaxis family, response regulator CheY n=1 Tax=Gracilimonas mengyeensis TaxID=1302730 RepID=A0A521D700_9BACT|nr:response regulator [Gracilimonas mengyeensis]SMO67486.1 two-component system, chemotaxis family, response regulator CheY [Gracilimonas mengyeensis]
MPINILVVDDSAVMRSMIKKTIHRSNVDVGDIYEASNGQEGLDILDQNWLDLLFIDVNMPIMDGMEMLDIIRNTPDTRDLPVLIVSTESNKQRIEWINEHNAGFVHKPFTPEKLREKILSVLGVLD